MHSHLLNTFHPIAQIFQFCFFDFVVHIISLIDVRFLQKLDLTSSHSPFCRNFRQNMTFLYVTRSIKFIHKVLNYVQMTLLLNFNKNLYSQVNRILKFIINSAPELAAIRQQFQFIPNYMKTIFTPNNVVHRHQSFLSRHLHLRFVIMESVVWTSAFLLSYLTKGLLLGTTYWEFNTHSIRFLFIRKIIGTAVWYVFQCVHLFLFYKPVPMTKQKT